jgi:hypothetical protein
MSSITITDGRLQVIVCIVGGARPWGYGCIDRDECGATVVGYATRNQGVRGAEAHLKWHANGKPTCRDCGAWLSRKGSTRCRKGTCEADR